MDEQQETSLAEVRHLPVRRPDSSPTPLDTEVVQAELVSDEDWDEIQRRKQAIRYEGYRQTPIVLYRAARTVATHDRTKTAGRALVRHTCYTAAGVGVVVKRWRDAHGANRYERQMRAAEAAGDQEALRYWQEADVAEKQRRHDRVMDWVRSPKELVKAVAIGLAAVTGLLLGIGMILAVADGNAREVIGPIVGVLNAIRWTAWFLTAYGIFLATGTTAAILIYLHEQGRKHTEPPSWTAPRQAGEGDVMDQLPDEGTILNALKNLNIRGFNQALKEGWRIKFLMPPVIDGKGWRTQLALPPACPVEEIVKRKTTLAHNLVRYPIEVWPTEPQPAVLDLWVAKPGALSGPVDPWPLLEDLDNVTVDYFEGVPVGVTIKGDVVRGRLFEANYVMGGVMGSGKSTMAITLVLGAMLDPLVDIDVVVMAENADWEPMEPRLRSLTAGPGDDTVDVCMGILAELYDDLSVRGQALREHDKRAVTRELAEKDERLRPRIVVVDECQNLFMGKHSTTALEAASKLISTARKYAITLMFLTPEPSKDALPRKIITVASNKACYAIGDQMGNDAVLGTGSYKAGISAVGLVPKTDEGPGDVGTAMTRGFMAKPGLLRTFYVPQEDAHRVTDRAMELRQQRNITSAPRAEGEKRDLLEDVAEVLGKGDPIPAAEVAGALKTRWPRQYRALTGKQLVARLDRAYGVKVPSTGNRWPIDPVTVRERLAELATLDLDEE
ncbi:hypothetical protein [Amycolatopsis taiwanensis]|uniref:hypothetical protein n=1 Tax=Amycolatopsis taiwanensis TaxID=342230 RepID=UPI0006945F71|nr:hypothetical protein [Amycolatopsis taiwanensis]